MMDKLTGWRTVIVAALALIYALLPLFGVKVPGAEDQVNIEAFVTAALMFVMRFFTKTPIGTSTTTSPPVAPGK